MEHIKIKLYILLFVIALVIQYILVIKDIRKGNTELWEAYIGFFPFGPYLMILAIIIYKLIKIIIDNFIYMIKIIIGNESNK